MIVEDLLATMAIVLAVALVSGLLGYHGAFMVPEAGAPDGEAGLPDSREPLHAGLRWVFRALVAGVVAAAAYLWVDGQWPAASLVLFATMGLGCAVALTAAAVILRPRCVSRLLDIVVLNLAWGVGYGVAIPLLLQ